MMKLIDIDSTRGHLLLSVLNDNGIRAHLRDEHANHIASSVWIENDNDYDIAIKYVNGILDNDDRYSERNKKMVAWVCIVIGILAIIFFLLVKLH